MARLGMPAATTYQRLQGQPVPAGQLAIDETAVSTPSGNVALGMSSTGTYLLLIPVDKKLDDSTLQWSNQSIHFGFRSVTRNGAAHAFLVLECVNSRLGSTFCLLVDDILEAIPRTPGEPEAAAKATLERWRALLREQRRPFLSDDALVGLLGELTFLEELTEALGPGALSAWAGPTSGRHDFISKKVDVEVKSTTAHDWFPITVHGASQLVPAPSTSLYIQGYRFEHHPTGDSVPAILGRLRRLGIDRLDILRLTELVGYSELDARYYASRTYAMLESKRCLVDSSFPRLTEETVPKELLTKIRGLTYIVDLSTIAPSPISLEAFATPATEDVA